MLRKNNTRDALFVSTIEVHGSYDPAREIPVNPFSNIANVKIIHDNGAYTAVTLKAKNGTTKVLIVSNANANAAQHHQLKINDKEYQWTGPYYFDTIN